MAQQQKLLAVPYNPAYNYAFWEYDQFPYCVGDTITRAEAGEDGRIIVTPEHFGGRRFKPFNITNEVDGRVAQKQLELLSCEYQRKLNELRNEYKRKAESILPALKNLEAYK